MAATRRFSLPGRPSRFSITDVFRALPGLGVPFVARFLRTTTFLFLAAGLGAYGVAGVVGHTSLPFWLVTLMWLVLVGGIFVDTVDLYLATTYAKQVELNLARLADAGRSSDIPSCPRCTRHSRTASGWCPACFDRLSSRPDSRTEVVVRHERARDQLDGRAFRATIAPRLTTRFFDGRETTETPDRNWRRWRTFTVVADDTETDIEFVGGDPDDPTLAWARTRSTVASRKRGIRQDLRSVSRYRITDGRISENTGFTPLPIVEDGTDPSSVAHMPLWP